MKKVATIPALDLDDNGYAYPSGLLLHEDRLIAIDSGYRYNDINKFWYYGTSVTFVRVYDVSDPTQPKLLKQHEMDGSYAMIFDIVECTEVFYPELGQYFPVFDGYSLIPGEYSEITSNGEILKHKFDGQFHEKWQIFFAHGNAFTGVSHAQFDSYVKQLIKQGFKGTVVNERLDGCSAYLFDGINTEKGVYTSMIYNENLMSLDIVYTNVGV